MNNISTSELNKPNAIQSPNKNLFPLLLVLTLVGLTLIAAIILIIVFSCTKDNHPYIKLNRTTKVNKPNIISMNYVIDEDNSKTVLFHPSFIDSVESIKINGENSNITNIKNLNKGNNEIEIKFKEDLTSLEDLFFMCNTLQEINLYNLSTNKVTSTANMFYGCSNLKKVDLTEFNTKNIKNISNMFSGCSKLTSIDMNIFNNDKLIDIQGLFSDCTELKSLDLEDFNTNNVINMSNMFYNCSSLKNLNIKNFKTIK